MFDVICSTVVHRSADNGNECMETKNQNFQISNLVNRYCDEMKNEAGGHMLVRTINTMINVMFILVEHFARTGNVSNNENFPKRAKKMKGKILSRELIAEVLQLCYNVETSDKKIMLDKLKYKCVEQHAEDNVDAIHSCLMFTLSSKILYFLKDDLINNHDMTLNQVFVSEGNEGVLKIMRAKHMELTLRRCKGRSKLDETLNKNVRDSCLVFLHCTAKNKEILAHCKEPLHALTCSEESWRQELTKLTKILCEKIKHDQSERGLDTNLIKNYLRNLIDSNLSTRDESCAKAFLERLEAIRAFHYENELRVKGGSIHSVTSSNISKVSGQKRYYDAHNRDSMNESKHRSLEGCSTSSDSHQLKRNRNMMPLTSSPNHAPRKRENESSFTCDDDSNTFVSALTIGSANFSVTNEMKNTNVDATIDPPLQLEFYTTSMKSQNEHKSSCVASSQSKASEASSKFHNNIFTPPPCASCGNESMNTIPNHSRAYRQQVLKK